MTTATKIDKLTEYLERNAIIQQQGEMLFEKLDKLTPFIERYLEEAKIHLADAPIQEGDLRNRIAHKALRVCNLMGHANEGMRAAKNLTGSVVQACKSVDEEIGAIKQKQDERDRLMAKEQARVQAILRKPIAVTANATEG